jgi:hypothetical protein
MMRALIVVRTVKTYMSVASTVMAGVSEMNHGGTCAGANGTMTTMASAGRVHERTVYRRGATRKSEDTGTVSAPVFEAFAFVEQGLFKWRFLNVAQPGA